MKPFKLFVSLVIACLAVVGTVFTAAAAKPLAPARQTLSQPQAPQALAAKCTKLTAGEVTWATLTADGDVDEVVEEYPADTITIVPMFAYGCVPAKTTVVTVFTLDGETVFTGKETLKADTKEGTYLYPLSTKDETAFDPGEWGVQFFLSKTLLTSGTVMVGGEAPANSGVTVQGTITDKKSKKPIKTAYVFVLNPGVTIKAWIAANYPDKDLFTSAESDAKGKYVLESQLERNTAYAVIVVAKGYKPASSDAFEISDKDKDPLELNVTLSK